VSSALVVTPPAARRFLRRALLLDPPGATDLTAALTHLGFVQIDPINVCGRMHDLILRNRVPAYREGDLMRHLHGEGAPLAAAARVGFEQHMPGTHILVAFPLEAWPHLLAAMRRRTRTTSAWSGRLTPRERALSERILAELAARGPLSSDDIDDPRRARRVWGASTLAKSTLQKLFFHGRVLISHRVNQRRVYDLPERVLPAATLARPVPPAGETARWLVQLKLRQRRLALLKREELRLVDDLVQPVAVEGCPLFHCLREDAPALHAAAARDAAATPVPEAPLLLAPLDPLIYDRRATAALWGFDYTWEVYTPAARRVRGYYALPVLAGLELVGHVDPKADRPRGRLIVAARSIRRGHRISDTLSALARWLGLSPRPARAGR